MTIIGVELDETVE
jgi:hypothetical protein